MTISKPILICLTALLFTTSSNAKAWRGIEPLHSTMADVERLLGKPTKKIGDRGYYYNLKNEAVVVWLATSGCDSDGMGGCGWGWNVPSGTVTDIGIIPKMKVPVERFITKDFKQEACGINYNYFVNRNEGVEVESLNGRVTNIAYMPATADVYLRCPKVRDCPYPIIDRFDQYGAISFEDEKARLDNFAVELQNEPSQRGIIMGYGSRPGEARRRVARARKYIVKVRGIESWRLLAIDGGHMDQLTVQLNPLPMFGGTIVCADPTALKRPKP